MNNLAILFLPNIFQTPEGVDGFLDVMYGSFTLKLILRNMDVMFGARQLESTPPPTMQESLLTMLTLVVIILLVLLFLFILVLVLLLFFIYCYHNCYCWYVAILSLSLSLFYQYQSTDELLIDPKIWDNTLLFMLLGEHQFSLEVTKLTEIACNLVFANVRQVTGTGTVEDSTVRKRLTSENGTCAGPNVCIYKEELYRIWSQEIVRPDHMVD